MATLAEPTSLFFMEDEDDDDEDEDPSEAEDLSLLSPRGGFQRRVAEADGPRTIVASLFLPYTVSSVPVPPAPAAQLERRRSVGAVEFKRQRKASESRGLRPDPSWWHVEPSGLGNIGLQNAINSMKGRVHPLWVGSLGVSTAAWSTDTLAHVRENLKQEKQCYPVYLTDEEVEGHYNQFCKQVLWKPFHYQLPDYPKGPAYEKKAWELYVAVNEKFAETIVESYRPGDIVWINDYHLMLVPGILRRRLPNAIIAFFLHIPFPSSEIFRCFHVRKQILEGMLGADMIGFQTYPFMRHFLMTCTRLLRLESTPRGVQLDDRTVSVMPIPIGIDLDSLNEKRRNPEVAEIIASLKERYAGMKVLLGRDKNDYVKGVRQKLLAFERFLQDYPEWQGKVVLLQVALSTTEANENECRVSDVVARVNSRYGSIEYHPVVYLQQDISFSHYLALWTIADACVITSLRDGMNLTSHEFVVCQEENHGPLIISEFAGTYGSFGSALRVNPWDIQEVAEAMHDALIMSEEEKATRWKELYTHVVGNTAQTFVESFTSELIKAHEEVASTVATSIPPLPEDLVLTEYAHSRKRVFLLDQDGTIMNFNKHSSTTLLSSRIPRNYVTGLVQKLASDRRNMVYIMSGRCKSEMEDFNGMPNVGLCAENGCFLKYANRNTWETMLPDHDLSWRKQVLEIFEYYTDRTPGSYIEQKEIGMVWHYGHADMSFGSWQAAECQNHLEQALTKSFAIHVLAKKRSLEVMPRNVNKGTAIRRVLEHHQGRGPQSRRLKSVGSVTGRSARDRNISGGSTISNGHGGEHTEEYTAELDALEAEELALLPTRERVDFIMCLGDDRADEYMFEYLRRLELHSNSKDRCRSNPSTPFEELRSMVFSASATQQLESQPPILSPSSVTEDPATPLMSPPDAVGQESPTSPVELPLHTQQHTSHLPASLPADFNLQMPATANPAGAAPQSQPTPSHFIPSSNPASGSTRSKRCIVTATVGKKGSAAKWFMPGPQEVLALLEKFVALEKTHKRARNTVPEHVEYASR